MTNPRPLPTNGVCSASSSAPNSVISSCNALLVSAIVLLSLCLFAPSAGAQTVQFRSTPVRITVPLNSTDATIISNFVNLSDSVVDPVNLDVTGLPAGTGYTLTDTNGNPLLSTTIDTNLILTVFTTNISEGLYTFTLNGSGGATNSVPFILQAAHVWNGTLNASNNWNDASAWLGGVPTSTSDVVFGNRGAQTNLFNGLSFTNVGISNNVTIASLRFSQTIFTNDVDTNAVYHTIFLGSNASLSITGTNGFSLLRDQVDEFVNPDWVSGLAVNIVGNPGAKLVVSNANANFAMLLSDNRLSTLNIGNVNRMEAFVNRFALGDFQLYPFYRNYNDINDFNNNPRQFLANVTLAQTNIIRAFYANPNNYTNEYARGYAVSLENSEVQGAGGTPVNTLLLGNTNQIFAEGVGFIQANHQGFVRFATSNSIALFRNTNGTSRMAVFTISDDGGTNAANSNVKATIDFAGNNGLVDMLVDRLYISRDRTLITSNQTPNVQGDLLVGRGIVDANTAILGFQEHDGKTDWTTTGGQAYLNYCQGRLVVTNGGLFRVNQTLTLGYTADTNPEAAAQQYNTFGRITIYSNSTVTANKVVCDGNLNFTSISQQRQNQISMNQGAIMVVTNTIGGAAGAAAGDTNGLPLDTLNMTAATLWLKPIAGKTNVFVRNLNNFGTTPSIIKVFNISGVTVFPTNIPLISYENAQAFLAADMSASGLSGVQGYIINNTDNKTIDLFLTTNASRQLKWTGAANNQWNLTSLNWLTTNNTSTAFALGDSVTFDDSTTVNSIDITAVVVPAQTGTGVLITNQTRPYTFNAAGGAVAGTASVIKNGAASLTFNAAESGPLTVYGGSLSGSSSGNVGNTTIASNVVVNFSGTMNGLTSTGLVTVPSGGIITGPLALRGGKLANSGTVNSTSVSIVGSTMVTNNADGIMNLQGTYEVTVGSLLANFGTINHMSSAGATRMNISGTYFGNGFVYDVDGTDRGNDGRVNMLNNRGAFLTPGATMFNSIGNLYFGSRTDLNGGSAENGAGKVWIEVDFNNAQTNDMLQCDRWNNIDTLIVMTNINPGAGTFASGQSFQILANNNGLTASNFVDNPGIYPLMYPFLPAPGCVWDLSHFMTYGVLSITNIGLVWNGTSPTWDGDPLNTTWKSGQAYTDGKGALFDDTASGSTTITLATNVAPCGYNRDTNIIVGVSTNFVYDGPAFSPGLMFSNSAKDYTISGPGRITGRTALYKTGSGTLTILTTNDFAGGIIAEGGTIAVTNMNGLGIPSPNGAQVFSRRGAYDQFWMNGATLRFFGPTNATSGRFITTDTNGATFEIVGVEFDQNQNVRGPGSVTKTGNGILKLSQAGSDYSGATFVNQGMLRISVASGATNTINVANGTSLEITNTGNGITLTNPLSFTSGSVSFANFKTNTLVGEWNGAASVTASSIGRMILNGDISGFSGSLSLGSASGSLQFNSATNSNANLGSAAAAFDLGSGSVVVSNNNGAGLTYSFGALSGGGSTILAGRSSTTAVWPAATTYSIGAKNTDTVFSGRIMNGVDDVVSVVKVGSGKLTLNGINGFTGSLTVSNGTLGGSGSIASNLVVVAGGTFAPGSSIGIFTVGGSATLGGTTVMEISQINAPKADQLAAAGAITATNGTLIVTNIGPDLINGTKFTLFNKAATGFSSVSLPPTGPSGPYVWINNVDVDGTITLSSGGLSQNPNIARTQSGSGSSITMTLSWPPSYQGYDLQSNSVSLSDPTKWFQVSGSITTTQINTTVDINNTNVFFRLHNVAP